MSAQENEALVRRYFEEVWGKGNLAAVDAFIAPNYVEHSVPHGSQPKRDTLKQYVAMYHDAFPDVKCTLHDILAQGNRVAYRWSASGTHLGEWAGIPPTGNHMMATGITILRIADGKVVEGWLAKISAARRKRNVGSPRAGEAAKRTWRGSPTYPWTRLAYTTPWPTRPYSGT